jgi:hypothetical protein
MRLVTMIIAGVVIVIASVALLSFSYPKTSIAGKVNPADAAELVWLIGQSDSMKAVPSMGLFAFDVKPGTYKLIVDAKDPYKDVLLDNLQVKQDEVMDLGEIPLKQ